MTWLSELVQQHNELESPQAFWYWSGLCAISAVMKDQVYLDRGGAYKLYPNIYVMLHADSGLKKGPPVGLAKDLVRRVNNTRIISGRSSIQGILKELGTGHTKPGGQIFNKSVGFIVASEFSSSLVNDPAAMTILTDLYDRQYNEGEWKSLLKMESFELKDPTLSLLVATNEAHFSDFIEAKDIHGGFIGRMFVIAESKVQRLNPLIKKMKVIPNREDLSEYLKKLSTLNGPFESLEDTEAGEHYEHWYNEFYNVVRDQDVQDETGTIQRFGDSVLKVAMLLSLSESPNLVINTGNMIEAITVCERLIGNVRKTTHGKKGMSTSANLKALLIKELLRRDNHQVTRKILMHKMWMHYSDANEFDDIMQSFDQTDMIKTETIGNQITYRMPDEQVEKFAHYLGGKDD